MRSLIRTVTFSFLLTSLVAGPLCACSVGSVADANAGGDPQASETLASSGKIDLWGTVRWNTGTTYNGARVQLMSHGQPQGAPIWTNPAGRYALRGLSQPTGDYAVRLIDEDGDVEAELSLPALHDQDQIPDLRVPSTVDLWGTVLDRDAAPVVGASLVLVKAGRVLDEQIVTNIAGRYGLYGLHPRTSNYSIRVIDAFGATLSAAQLPDLPDQEEVPGLSLP